MLRTTVLGVATLAVALAAGAGVAQAGGGAALALQVFPSTLVAGGPGFAFATFTNTGSSTLTHAVVNVDLGGGTFSLGGSSATCAASASGATCSLGDVTSGGVVLATVAFTAPASGPLTVTGTATWDSATVGGPRGAAAGKNSATAQASANIVTLSSPLVAVAAGCVSSGGSVTAGDMTVGIGANTTGLPCAPIVVGTQTNPSSDNGCEAYFTKVPSGQLATATLTFGDECLPWPNNEDGTKPPEGFDFIAGTTLFENPAFPNPGPEVVVPACNEDGSIPSLGSEFSTDSCVVSVTGDDPDFDDDAGTITLHVIGTAGDGEYSG